MSRMTLSDTVRNTTLKGYETGGKMVGSKLVLLPKGQPALSTYLDDAGVPTIGWGRTGTIRGRKLTLGMTCSYQEAEDWLDEDVREHGDGVNRLIEGGAETNQNQFDALVLLTFNIGVAGLAGSTLLKYHKAGKFDLAAKQFARWNKITKNGKKVEAAGLTRRRAEEASIYQREVERLVVVDTRVSPVPMPEFDEQASKRVEPATPSPVAASPGVIGAAAAVVPAVPITYEAVATATSTLKEIRQEADQVQTLAWFSSFLGIIIFLLAAYIIWRRWQDNRNGVK